MMFEERNKIQQISIVESPVFKIKQPAQVIVAMPDHKIIGIIIHAFEQVGTLVNDSFPLAPSQNCRKKCGNFDILFFSKTVGNTDWIVNDEIGLVILRNFLI